MIDHETLEMAGKAAGLRVQYSDNCGDFSIGEPYSQGETRWNPLEDDADALRLALATGLKVDAAKHEVWYCKTPALGKWIPIGWDNGIEGLRRAITWAAAEIGRAMP